MRKDARELAFKLIYERLFVKEDYTLDEEFFALLKKDEDKTFARQILSEFEKNKNELDKIISSKLIGYEISRVYKIVLALIYEALTEIYYIQTPPQVAVNEVLNLAKVFSTEKSSKFINGVLSSIINKSETAR